MPFSGTYVLSGQGAGASIPGGLTLRGCRGQGRDDECRCLRFGGRNESGDA